MIILNRLNDTAFTLNSDLIETIEETPDTTIRLTTKNYHIVRESMAEVIALVVQFRKSCNGIGKDIPMNTTGRTTEP